MGERMEPPSAAPPTTATTISTTNANPANNGAKINSTPTLIPIGTHRLSACLSGPSVSASASDSRSSENPSEDADPSPLIVIIPGSGDVASSYVAVERLLRPYASILLYDRSGLGKSEKDPDVSSNSETRSSSGTAEPTAVRAARQLHALLSALNLTPSTTTSTNHDKKETAGLILLAHSYGGIIAREFYHLYPDLVSGMVLVDSSTERASEFFSIPDANIAAVLGDLNFARVTGLRTESVLSDAEWRVRAKDIYAGIEMGGAQRESSALEEVCETLKAKRQIGECILGEKPLVVIQANTVRDYERVYEAGVEAGNGSGEQRRGFRELLDRWEGISSMLQQELLGLSRVSRFVRLRDCGHNVHILRPDVVVREVRWVVERVLEEKRKGSASL
ncbi:Alpha/Beta hydrolase protein [Aspergillus karnatakaensis]|uniref:alpha/beta fold hydrolase n=1 Tax=Aspergillus karnatakaensis TaxID=1810916 RepID=UPI003CCCEAEC